MNQAVTELDRDLKWFAVELFERSGGTADWPEPTVPGSAIVPAELVKTAHLPSDEFLLSTSPDRNSLHVSLASDFLDVAGRVLGAAVPHDGSLAIRDRNLTNRDLREKASQTFAWQNARAQYQSAEPSTVTYHLWTFFASMRSEDTWENTIQFTVNSATGAVVELPRLLDEPGLVADSRGDLSDAGLTYELAIVEARRRLVAVTTDFVRRIEQRLERDRKRIQEYYRALAREAGTTSGRRAAADPTATQVAERKRAVDLELRRKLAELTENYAVRAELRPLALVRVRVPVLMIPVIVQRKKAVRTYRLYWNPLTRACEPLACHQCHRPTYSATCTNDTVDLLCNACV